jgi:hypothetical protein
MSPLSATAQLFCGGGLKNSENTHQALIAKLPAPLSDLPNRGCQLSLIALFSGPVGSLK